MPWPGGAQKIMSDNQFLFGETVGFQGGYGSHTFSGCLKPSMSINSSGEWASHVRSQHYSPFGNSMSELNDFRDHWWAVYGGDGGVSVHIHEAGPWTYATVNDRFIEPRQIERGVRMKTQGSIFS